MSLSAWCLPTEITIYIMEYVLFEGYFGPERYQSLNLLMVCHHWRLMIETFNFRYLCKVCKTDDAVDLFCSIIQKDGRLFHLRDLDVDLKSLPATQCIVALRCILEVLSRLDEDKNNPHPGITLELHLRSDFVGCTASSQSAAIERDLLLPLPKVDDIRDLVIEVYCNPSTVAIAKRLAESAPRAFDRAFEFRVMLRKGWDGRRFTRPCFSFPMDFKSRHSFF